MFRDLLTCAFCDHKKERAWLWTTLLLPSLLFSPLLLTGCSKNTKPPPIPTLLDRQRDMSIQRTDLGHSASVRFFTKRPTYCTVEHWPIALGDNPAAEKKRRTHCFRRKPQYSHFVRIENLKKDEPLYVRILVSSSDPTLMHFNDRLVLKESSAPFSYFPPSGYEVVRDDDVLVSVIKANLSQASASVYSNRLAPEVLTEEKGYFSLANQETGCKPYPIPHPGSLLPPRRIGLHTVSTSGYYSISGLEINKSGGIFLLDFTGKREAAKDWSFAFHFLDLPEATEYKFAPPPELKAVTMVHPKNTKLQKHDLVNFSSALEVDPSQGLTFSWEARNIAEDDTVEILIGKPSLGQAIKCHFSSKTQTLRVEAETLEPFEKSREYDVIVSLNRRIVEDSASNERHVVFLHTHDWRHKTLIFR